MSFSLKYKSFAFTIRPRQGVTDDQIKTVTKYCKNHCTYYHVITEKDAEQLHLHVGMFLKEPRARNKINEEVFRHKCFKDLDSQERPCQLNGTKIMYNRDWVNKYCDKEDNTVVIASNLPELHHIDHFFPSKEEQDKAKAKAALNNAADKRMCRLEQMWYECRDPGVEVNYTNVAHFYSDMMYCTRVLRVIHCPRKLSQQIHSLVRYINKKKNFEPIDYYGKELAFQ